MNELSLKPSVKKSVVSRTFPYIFVGLVGCVLRQLMGGLHSLPVCLKKMMYEHRKSVPSRITKFACLQRRTVLKIKYRNKQVIEV